MAAQERTVGAKTVFRGRILRVEVLDIETEAGVRSVREIVRHPGAVAILGETPDGRFVLVRQFRKAIEQTLLEAVAGTLEPGEEPDRAAARELREETGYEAAELRKLGVICLAPGYSDERLHVYYARLAPGPAAQSPDEDEVMERVYLTREEMEASIRAGEIGDAKTLAAWMLLRALATSAQGGTR